MPKTHEVPTHISHLYVYYLSTLTLSSTLRLITFLQDDTTHLRRCDLSSQNLGEPNGGCLGHTCALQLEEVDVEQTPSVEVPTCPRPAVHKSPSIVSLDGSTIPAQIKGKAAKMIRTSRRGWKQFRILQHWYWPRFYSSRLRSYS